MIFFRLLIGCSIAVVINCKFESVTQYGSICEDGENIWTVGYEYRFIESIVHCTSGCMKQTSEFIWCKWNFTTSTCQAYSGIVGDNTSSDTSWTSQNDTHLIAKLEFANAVESSPQNLSFALRTIGKSETERQINITVKYCPKNITNDITIDASSGGTYGANGTISCPIGEQIVNRIDKTLITDAAITCGTCAKWEETDQVGCWRVPKVSLSLTNLNQVYVAGDILNATEICNVTDVGKPETNPYLSWSTGNSNNTMTTVVLKVEDNNKTIYCAMKNDLTDLLEEDPVLNDPLQLSIQFGPTELSNQTSCARFEDGSNLYNATLELFFSANPIGTAKFLDKNREPKNFTATNETAGCCGVPVQRYRIDLTNISADYSITFNYRQEGPNETTLQFEDLTKSCRSTGMTTAFIGLIVGIAVGGVILIILIIIMIVLIIRRRRKGDISDPPAGSSNIQEERANPLYGTTELNSSGESKEVVENVLYGTRDATNSPADEYAEVVPKGKRKKTKTEPKDNGEAAASAEATYAVVDKKNKGKSGSDNAGYSGDPQPEETYAVVNKKGKKT